MRDRLPLILSTTALLVAVFGSTPLGEAAYNAVAPSSIGASQLRNGAVTNAKLRGDAVTSGKVLNHSLKAIDFAAGQIPTGPKGDKGDKGSKGDKGDKGVKGDKGDPAALTCPSGTMRFVSVCIETASRAPKDWGAASDDCADEQRRLPSSGEIAAFRKQPGITIATAGEWTADLGDITYKPSFVMFAFTQTGNGVTEYFTPTAYRCVAGLQNAS
jgi:hypothetical protein